MSTTAPVAPIASVTPARVAPVAAMQIVVSRQDLLSEVAAACALTSTQTTVPILSHLLLEANGSALRIRSTNLSQSLATTLTAKVAVPGAVAVPAKKFYDYIRLLPAGDITIKVMENDWVHITSGRSRTKLVGNSFQNFPAMPHLDPKQPVVSLDVHALRSMIRHTSFAVSREESRYILRGSLATFTDTTATMVATDGHRLALYECKQNLEGLSTPISFILPEKAGSDLPGLMEDTDAEKVLFSQNDTELFFQFSNRMYVSNKVAGTFPNYRAVIPTANNARIILRVLDFERSLRRVSQFADERSGAIRLSLDSSQVVLSSSTAVSGTSEDSLDTTYSGAPILIGLNSEYLLDVCKALGGTGEMTMSLKDGTSAVVIEPETQAADTSYLVVVMPMRV